MAVKKLQKTALQTNPGELPVEVLDPHHSSTYYSVKMYQPGDGLNRYIDDFWVMRWELPADASFTAEIIPSAYINLTFMEGGSKITGVTTGKYTYDVRGKGVIVGAKFKPGGFYALTKHAASDITDKVISGMAVFPKATDQVNTNALASKDDGYAIELLQGVLSGFEHVDSKDYEVVTAIIGDVKNDKYNSVAMVADAYGMQERRLQELFQRYVGVGLKWVILRYRLIHATRLALSPSVDTWTRIALELGYTDQAHFINDFKRIIGQTPKQYAAATKPVDTP